MKAVLTTNGEVITMTNNFKRHTNNLQQIEVVYSDGTKGFEFTGDLDFYVSVHEHQTGYTAKVNATSEQQAESILDNFLEGLEYSRAELNLVEEEKGEYYFNLIEN